MDLNTIILNNIISIMKDQNVKQIDLAEKLGLSKQIMSKMLNGGRIINAAELVKIAGALNISVENLVKLPSTIQEKNVIRAFMGKVNTDEAKKGLEIVDNLASMIVFHTRTYENGMRMIGNREE